MIFIRINMAFFVNLKRKNYGLSISHVHPFKYRPHSFIAVIYVFFRYGEYWPEADAVSARRQYQHSLLITAVAEFIPQGRIRKTESRH